MDRRLLCLERLNKRQEVRFWIRKPDMDFGEARLFLELTKKQFAALVRKGVVPYHKQKRRARLFNKKELNTWLVQICFSPQTSIERETAWYFIRRGRVRL